MQAAWINVLETGTVTVTSEAGGYPAYRLYDGLLSRMWRASGAGTQTIAVDQGASPAPVDALIVPRGHRLHGAALAFEHSPDGSQWTNLVSPWTQSGDGEIRRQAAAPVTARYLRMVISGAPAAPEAGEVLFTRLHAFLGPVFGAVGSIEPYGVRHQGIGGQPRFFILGAGARVLNYRDDPVKEDERSLYEEWFAFWADRQRPFYVVDHDGLGAFYEFTRPPTVTRVSVGLSAVEMELRQVY